MAIKQIQFMVKGMQKDLSVSKFNSEFAYEMMNIRLSAREDNTLLSATNAKGTLLMSLVNSTGTPVTLTGNYLGHCVLNEYLTIFTTDNAGNDKIYLLIASTTLASTMVVTTLFSGNLGFNTSYPIQTTGIYENENIQKVYWVDGLHQTRFINIAATNSVISSWTSNSFDFVQRLSFNELITVTKNTSGAGLFLPGAIQYAFSYYTKYGQETNIFYISPLQYTSYSDRGGIAGTTINNSFNISVLHPDTSFEYLRIYSILRTSLDATPSVNIVTDIKIASETTSTPVTQTVSNPNTATLTAYNKNTGKWDSITIPTITHTGTYTNTLSSSTYSILNVDNNYQVEIANGETLTLTYNVSYLTPNSVHAFVVTSLIISTSNSTLHVVTDFLNYTDNGTYESTIDASTLQYIGGEDIVFQAMTNKDNTLFLGNANIARHTVDTSVINHLNGGAINFDNKIINDCIQGNTGYYPYMNSLQFGESIKSLKYGEYYRFGIQFQHYTGKWSEAIFINDAQVTVSPYTDIDGLHLVEANYNLTDTNGDITDLVAAGYVKARPVIVFPTIADRNIIAQGICCPTVFNVGDRCNNSPFAQASWFLRPSLAHDIWFDQSNLNATDTTGTSAGQIVINATKYLGAINSAPNVDKTDMGVYAEFRHHHPIPNNYDINAEIQCIADRPNCPYVSYTNSDLKLYISNHHEYYFVDQSIVDFYSPEIEFDNSVQNLDMTDIKFRIVGYADFTSNISDKSIEVSSVGNDPSKTGFYKETIGVQNESVQAARSRLTNGSWVDNPYKDSNTDERTYFSVYPWHRNGSLNNEGNITGRTAMLSYNKTSNLKFALNTHYLSSVWNSYIASDNEKTGITNPVIFNSDEMTLVKIPEPKYSGLGNLNYYGNIDKALFSSRYTNGNTTNEGNYTVSAATLSGLFDTAPTSVSVSLKKSMGYPICSSGFGTTSGKWYGAAPIPIRAYSTIPEANAYGTDAVSIKYKTVPHAVFSFNYTMDGIERTLPLVRKTGANPLNPSFFFDATNSVYPLWNQSYVAKNSSIIIVDSCFASSTFPSAQTDYNNNIHYLIAYNAQTPCYMKGTLYTVNVSGSTYTWVQVTDLTTVLDKYTRFTNSFSSVLWGIESIDYTNAIIEIFQYWDDNYTSWTPGALARVMDYQDNITVDSDYPTMWIGELYRDTVANRFGGQTEEAFINNNWLPAGEPVSIVNSSGTALSSINVYYDKGDTFFQRYDCLKTYPYTTTDQNQLTDIASFMCETHVNLDGRYDRNRGLNSNLAVTPTNFNLMNSVYNQTNDFFTYHDIDHEKMDINLFPNSITWSDEKILGSTIDAWTNITYASSLDLDGDKGQITSLEKFNNEIYCFQEKGLSNILFNARVQIPTSDNVPIQITNGEKVSGKVYISNTIGCNNKWSIQITPSGIYFIDNITNSLYLYNGQIISLSDKLGFRQWISSQQTMDSWNPLTIANFRTFYDKNTNSIYFTNENYCLGYSELLQQFVSFFSYNGTPAMFNIDSNFYSIRNNQLWMNDSGDFNYFYGTYQPYYITYIVNPYENTDKIFNNIDFRADSWDGDTLQSTCPFDTIQAWNEYQSGATSLATIFGKPSTLQKKFRVWRANIPRNGDTVAGTKGLQRMRNTWEYIKLSNNTPNKLRSEIHDSVVSFTI